MFVSVGTEVESMPWWLRTPPGFSATTLAQMSFAG